MKTLALPSLLLLAPLALHRTSAFVLPSSPAIAVLPSPASRQLHHAGHDVRASSPTQFLATASDGSDASSTAELSRAPTLNGKAVLPVRAMTAGLKGHQVAAVYAVLNAGYKRGSGEGWEHVEHVGVTRDLAADIAYFLAAKGASDVAHIRALSFAYPQKAAMDDFANGWRAKVAEAGGAGSGEGWGKAAGGANGSSSGEDGAETATSAAVEGASNVITVGDEYEFDDDDEDMDDDDLDDYLHMMAEARGTASSSPAVPAPAPLFVDNTGLSGIVSLAPDNDKATEAAKEEVVSPFEKAVDKATVAAQSLADGEDLELNTDNVDRVLDEVRPYLISDGGNVSVHSVDSRTGNVYLLLEGACGSCASSTVTMQMGIERVLREKFGDALGEVAQVDLDDSEESSPTELTVEVVQAEVDRISTAIVAMGGVVRVVGVDPVGEVEVEFRGPNRVRKGLELALLDVEFVKHVKFVS